MNKFDRRLRRLERVSTECFEADERVWRGVMLQILASMTPAQLDELQASNGYSVFSYLEAMNLPEVTVDAIIRYAQAKAMLNPQDERY